MIRKRRGKFVEMTLSPKSAGQDCTPVTDSFWRQSERPKLFVHTRIRTNYPRSDRHQNTLIYIDSKDALLYLASLKIAWVAALPGGWPAGKSDSNEKPSHPTLTFSLLRQFMRKY